MSQLELQLILHISYFGRSIILIKGNLDKLQ